jgi:hypothetical protein
MKLDWKQFELGYKEAFSIPSPGETFQKGVDLVDSLRPSNIANNAISGIADSAMKFLPALSAISSMGANTAEAASPNITINMPRAPLTKMPGLNNPAEVVNFKAAGLLDPIALRNALTINAMKGGINTLVTPSHENRDADPTTSQVILESKYPDMKKLLANPETKKYLESLLTEDSSYGT